MFGLSQKKETENLDNLATIRWKETQGKKCIYFTFQGVFTENLAKEIVSQWRKMMEECNEEKVCLVCECSQMKDYDSLARIQFQSCMKEFQHRISGFWVVTQSKVAKYGGMIMGALLSFPIKVVESEEKIVF
ncbi:MAG: hypothetical protein OHK0045_13660 [Raineya sp.]